MGLWSENPFVGLKGSDRIPIDRNRESVQY